MALKGFGGPASDDDPLYTPGDGGGGTDPEVPEVPTVPDDPEPPLGTAPAPQPAPVPEWTFWETTGRMYEAGLDRGVLYPSNGPGVQWKGLMSVTEKAAGGEATPYYIDGEKHYTQRMPEEYGATIEAFTYPDEFSSCDGTAYMGNGVFVDNQPRRSFALSYRTMVGDTLLGLAYGYKIHLIYNALAVPSEKTHNSLDDSVETVTFSWDITTSPLFLETGGVATPLPAGIVRSSAHLIIDSTMATPSDMQELETIIYGTETIAPRMPTIVELFGRFQLGG